MTNPHPPSVPDEPEEPTASLHIEFRSADAGLRASFRQAVVAWLMGAEGALGRGVGAPEGLTVEEVAGAGASEAGATRIRARWWRRLAARATVAAAPDVHVFFRASADQPMHRALPPVIPAIEMNRPQGRRQIPDWSLAPAVSRLATGGARRAFAAAGASLRAIAAASRSPVLKVSVPVWHPRPAAVILAALTVATAGLTYAATQAHDLPGTARQDAGLAQALADREPGPGPLEPFQAAAVTTVAALGVPSLPGAAVTTPGGRPVAAASAGHAAAAVPGGHPLTAAAAGHAVTSTGGRNAVTPARDAAPSPAGAASTMSRARVASPESPPAASPGTDAKEPAVTARPARRPLTGSLAVTSIPAGAEVSVNGVTRGRTPLVIANVPAGSRIVRVELEGYRRWSWAVTVAGQARTPLTVRLQPDPGTARGTGEARAIGAIGPPGTR